MKKIFYVISIILFFTGCATTGLKTPSPPVGLPSGGQGEGRGEGAPPNSRIYFPFASYFILPEAQLQIAENILWLKKDGSAYLILEGHCDEIGPSEYNMELGDRRARSVKAFMMEKGVPPERIIMLVSYGSTRPLNPGHRVEDLRENRRVEFVVR